MKLVDSGHLDNSWAKTFANITKGVKVFHKEMLKSQPQTIQEQIKYTS